MNGDWYLVIVGNCSAVRRVTTLPKRAGSTRIALRRSLITSVLSLGEYQRARGFSSTMWAKVKEKGTVIEELRQISEKALPGIL
jgi:hypothetical protein